MKRLLLLFLLLSQFGLAQTEEKNQEKIKQLLQDYEQLFQKIGNPESSSSDVNSAKIKLKDLFTSTGITIFNDVDTTKDPGFIKIFDYVNNIEKVCPQGFDMQLLMSKAKISETKVNYDRNIYMATVNVKKMIRFPIVNTIQKDSITLDSIMTDGSLSFDTTRYEYTVYDTTEFKRVYNLVYYLQAFEQYDIFTSYQIFAIAPLGEKPVLEPLNGLNKWWVELDDAWKEVFKEELNLGEAPKPYYLKRIKSIQKIVMNDSKVSSLEPLRDFTSIKRLELKNTPITTLEPISNITTLKHIEVSESKLDTLLGLEKLVNLETFIAHDVDIVDISYLANCTKMIELDLSGNYIEDVSALKNMTYLEKLRLGSNKISDITPLQGLVNLTELNLSKNLVEDISPISSMTLMVELNLFNNPFTTLAPLARLNKVINLNVGYCEANSLDPIKNMRYLMYLDITGIKGDDFSALGNFTMLRELTVSRTSISSLDNISKHPYMQKLVMVATKIPVNEKDRYKKKNPKVQLTYY